jgi:hypothetical protein
MMMAGGCGGLDAGGMMMMVNEAVESSQPICLLCNALSCSSAAGFAAAPALLLAILLPE